VKEKGFTLLELLVAMALLLSVLGVAFTYFQATLDSTRRAQAKSELQDRVRMVMQVVAGDLQMAGARYWTQGATSLGFTLVGALSGTDGGVKDTLTVRYVTSLRDQNSACRRVDYGFNGDTLMRSDVNITPSSGTDCQEGDPSLQPLAEGILALDLQYLCSNGVAQNTPDCGPSAYPRSARVSVAGYSLSVFASRSNDRVRSGSNSQTLTTVTGQTLACPAGRICYALTQEVLMPNLKPVQ